MYSLKRDANHKAVGGAISIADLITPNALNFDPVTNRLLVELNLDANISSILPTHDKRDANHVPTAYGVSSADLITPLPVLVDHNNNYILVDMVFT